MINKSARVALIALACSKLGTSTKVNAVLHPSRFDLQEEATLATRGQDSGSLPTDDDLPTLASALAFDSVNDRGEDDYLLTAKERKALNRERTAYRIRADLMRPISPLALVII